MNNGHTSIPTTPNKVKTIAKTSTPEDIPASLPADLTNLYQEGIKEPSTTVQYVHTYPTNGILPGTTTFTTVPGYNSAPGLIFTKMSQVMKDIAHVSKDQTNTVQGFKFRGIDQFVNALYPALTKHGVFMVPSLDQESHELREVTRSNGKQGVDKHVYIQMSYTFFAEDGSSIIVGPIPAESVDSGDKATNKALSAALKYALIQTFSIPTEDMAEGDAESPEIGVDAKTTVKAPNSPVKRTFTPPARAATPKTETTANGSLNDAGIGYPETASNAPQTASETNNGTNNVVEAAPVTAPKKPRGQFNPPRRTPKTEVREE
jgi:hypothetical protein